MTPDILNIILQKVDDMNIVPHEISQQRRKPMSLRHALLIYGDTSSAKAAWREAQKEEKKRWEWMVNNPNGGLHSCLLVSRLWYQVASDILYDKVHFKSQKAWNSFLENSIASHGDERLRSSVMVLHKIKSATQDEIDLIGSKVGGNLKWLEFYTCPSIVPGPELLAGEKVTKVVLAGCSRVDDRTLSMIAHNCPRLQHLDLRACDLVSDHGLKKIARYCPDLRLLNVGRTERGERVTYKAIKHLARRTSIQTLGLAGCHVDDRAMWELALHRGPHLQRLSLNDCRLLTNFSIPRILVYMPNLSVLELRACEQITDMRPIVQFKRYRELQGHPPLIEGCEVIELRMKEAEWLLEVEASRRIIDDCLEWIYSADSDVDNAEYCHSPASIVVVS
jgi:antagonist of mitotic exit network protein 1